MPEIHLEAQKIIKTEGQGDREMGRHRIYRIKEWHADKKIRKSVESVNPYEI